jgi:two-component system response regulator BaeR
VPEGARILVVEDEEALADSVRYNLEREGYGVSTAADGRRAIERFRDDRPDLVILDLMLPELSGLDVCRLIRQESDVPIIMVTAKVEEIDRLLGLQVGADDYVCKPFSPRELMLRIQAVLRRRRAVAPAAPGLVLDANSREARIDGHAVTLTRSEFRVLEVMVARPGVIFSRAQLLDALDHDALDTTDRAMDTHIKHLRRKLATVAPTREWIESVYGVGYRLTL